MDVIDTQDSWKTLLSKWGQEAKRGEDGHGFAAKRRHPRLVCGWSVTVFEDGVMWLEATVLGSCCSVEGFLRSEIQSQTSLQAPAMAPMGDDEGLSQRPETIKSYTYWTQNPLSV